jgi:hydrogenase nickel incorporation protein HypA/HybF
MRTMHELSITRNIVAIVSEAAGNRRVRQVTIEVGRLSGVVPDAIAFCFDVVAKDTMLDGARLDIRLIDGRARCDECGSEFATETVFERCPCGSNRVSHIAGEELTVTTMELEEAA